MSQFIETNEQYPDHDLASLSASQETDSSSSEYQPSSSELAELDEENKAHVSISKNLIVN